MKRFGKFALSLVVTGVCMGWAFHDTNWNQQWDSLKTANWGWLIPFELTLIGIHLCRTIRWGSLLSGLEKVPFRKLNEASAIGFMMLIILPFRLGEFARPFLIAQRSSIRKSAAMTTVVLERIADGITMAVMLRVLLFFVPDSAPQVGLVRFAGNAMFGVFFGGLMFLLFALWQQRRAVALVRMTLGRVAPGLGEKAAGVVDTFVGAMRQLPSAGHIVGFLALTAVYWGLNGWGMTMLAKAFACDAASPGCVPFEVTLFQAFVVLGCLVVGVMIPSAPGSMGTFQAAVKIGLALFLPAAAVTGKGIAYANVLWFAQMSTQVITGILFMLLGHMSFRDLAGKLSDEDKAPPPPSDSLSTVPAP